MYVLKFFVFVCVYVLVQVFLSLYGGVKTRIFVDHISTGRLTVAKADSKSIQ